MAQNKYLDYAGLQIYDTKIKEYIEEKEYDDSALLALHAFKKDADGNETTEKMTVSEEASAAVAAVVDGAPEAFNTLKEIANWINDSDANEAGYNAVSKINNLESAVGTPSVPAQGTEGEEDYVAKIDATGLFADVEALQEAEYQAPLVHYFEDGTVGTTKLNQATIIVNDDDNFGSIEVKKDSITLATESSYEEGPNVVTGLNVTNGTIVAMSKDHEDNTNEGYSALTVYPRSINLIYADSEANDAKTNGIKVSPNGIFAKVSEDKKFYYNNEEVATVSVIGTEAVPGHGEIGDEDYVAEVPATGLIADVRSLQSSLASADTYTAITDDEIDALFEPESTETE